MAIYEEVKSEKQIDSYAVFERLRSEKGVSVYRVAHDLKIPESSFSLWKRNRFTPKYERLKKIAEYFGATVDDFYRDAQQTEGGEK